MRSSHAAPLLLIALSGCGEARPTEALSCSGANLQTDARNCGKCRHVCVGAGRGCFAGACTAPAPLATARFAGAVTLGPDGRIYVMGGIRDGMYLDSVEAYDANENRWANVGKLSVRRARFAAASFDDKVWAIGGAHGCVGTCAFAPAPVDLYNLSAWENGPALPETRAEFALVAASSELLAIWGYSGWVESPLGQGATSVLDSLSVHQSNPDSGAESWLLESATPVSGAARYGARGVELGGKVYLLGGSRGPESAEATVDVLDPTNGNWDSAAPMLMPRTLGAAAVGSDGRIYYAGGYDYVDHAFVSRADVQVYDPDHDSEGWKLAASLPERRADVFGVSLDGRIWVIAGNVSDFNHPTATGDALIYDPKYDEWYW